MPKNEKFNFSQRDKRTSMPDMLRVPNSFSALSAISTASITISASEMEELFRQWTAKGKGDLIVNYALTEKIRTYLEWQKKTRPLMIKLANSQFENFLVPGQILHENVLIDIILNDSFIGNFCWYGVSTYFCILKFADFRWILNHIGNEFANYAYLDDEVFIDVASWVLFHKGEMKPENGKWYITIKEQ